MPGVVNAVTMRGKPLTLTGNDVQVGQSAPDCTLIANDLSEFKLSSLKGKKVIISAVPSLDTPVCDTQTRRFNQEATGLGSDIVVLTVSMDLPFAQKRWCGAAGMTRVQTLSDHREGAFGKAYGILVSGLRLLARAVFVVDAKGILQHKQIVEEITTEPNYEKALQAVRNL